MGVECVDALIKEEKVEYQSVPPGFGSLTSFILKKIDDSKLMASVVASGAHLVPMSTEDDIDDDANLTESLRCRPWINYSEFDGSMEESESEKVIEKVSENLIPRSLPEGVLHGCSECSSQKVVAKWNPENACRMDLEEAPVFYPTEEEFKDALKYIATIRPRAEKYGICRIVPPPTWSPPCPLKEKSIWENSKFTTRIQQIHKLQNSESIVKSRVQENPKSKKRKYQETEMQCAIGSEDVTFAIERECSNEVKPFGFEPGPSFTLEAFQKYAHDFKSHHFENNNKIVECDPGSSQKQWEPSVEEIEGEYWRIIEKPTEEIEVFQVGELDTGVFGSGFPKVSPLLNSDNEVKYSKSEWNLNNLARLPSSVLSLEKIDTSGVIVPWLYVGMCFSSFCWHVEDHYLYSLNYIHWGAPKLWYGVPGADAEKLEAVMKKRLPDLFKEQPDLLHKLVPQLSPSSLTSESVPVYRCVQNPKEFVLTFPRAYHSGFSCGFNCAEAVNVAPLDWLPYGQHAVELYREQCRKTTISHDKLLFGAARETIRAQWEIQLLGKNTADNLRWKGVCGKEGDLAKALKKRVELERTKREHLCFSNSMKMDSNFDAASERECVVCLYNLHLSAVGCQCCPEKFACLHHAEQLCRCALSEKTFFFRYTIDDLNVLVEALEGKLSAIYRWAKLDLGLALSSFVPKDKSQSSSSDGKPFNSLQGIKQEDTTSISSSPRLCQEFKVPAVPLRKDAGLTSSIPSYDDRLRPSSYAKEQVSHQGNMSVTREVTKEDYSSHLSRQQVDHGKVYKPVNSSMPPTDYKLQSFPQPYGNIKPNNESKDEKKGLRSNLTNTSQTSMGSSSHAINAHDKGPHNAKEVRKVSCIVQPLEFGVVQPGKLWSSIQAIYPKGFKSRVSYLSVLDPCKCCYYISEILDAGQPGPLFMVKVETCPSEVFVHLSVTKCWDMVRNRVNEEIFRQKRAGRLNLPNFQPKGTLDGFQMFGFSSSHIIKGIEAVDPNRVCREYWKSREEETRPFTAVQDPISYPSDEVVLKGLFKKANTEELHSLERVLSRRGDVNRLVTEEIHGRFLSH